MLPDDNRVMQSWRKLGEVLAHPDARRGARQMMAFAPGMAAWALVTGIVMVNSGSRHQAGHRGGGVRRGAGWLSRRRACEGTSFRKSR